jgi:hypothetical protein
VLSIGIMGISTNETPNIFGYSGYLPQKDDAEIPNGSLIIVNRNITELKQGEAAVFYDAQAEGKNKFLLQYVYKVENGQYDTRKSDVSNQIIVGKDDVRGKAVAYMPVVGSVMESAYTIPGIIVFSVVLIILLGLIILLIVKCKHRNREYERGDDLVFDGAAPEQRDEQQVESIKQEEGTLSEKDRIMGAFAAFARAESLEVSAREDSVMELDILGDVMSVISLSKIVGMVKEKLGSDTLIKENEDLAAGSIKIIGTRQELIKVCDVLDGIRNKLQK